MTNVIKVTTANVEMAVSTYGKKTFRKIVLQNLNIFIPFWSEIESKEAIKFHYGFFWGSKAVFQPESMWSL